MISNEVQNKNLAIFFDKLEKVGISTAKISEELSNDLLVAPFTNVNDNGMAFEGSLLHIVLRTLTPYAIKINDVLPDNLKVDTNSLIKVCLLSHLSKCKMFIPNDNTWEVTNRSMPYKFAPCDVSLRTGIKSIMLAQKMGIEFTDVEVDAMTILDRDADLQAKYFSSPLATIVRQAYELTLLQFKNQNK